jgi:NAD(P)-dependent dehydrogenase (short-subunit alcohol dehydrogenase family)
MTHKPQQTVLITGASSGFGALSAEKLTQLGYTVYGTSQRDLPNTDAGVRMRVLDVTDPKSVQTCIDGILDETGRIDTLINSAGIGQLSLAEETPMNTAAAIMQTNFWGMVRTTRAVLPGMRQHGGGRVLFMSSLAGLVGTPGQSFYSASKHAVEGFAESLHVELVDLPIDIVIIEPGFFATELETNAPEAENTISDYDKTRANVTASISTSLQEGDDPAIVADKIADIVTDDSPKLRYRIGDDAWLVPLLKNLMPRSVFEIGLLRRFGLNE